MTKEIVTTKERHVGVLAVVSAVFVFGLAAAAFILHSKR